MREPGEPVKLVTRPTVLGQNRGDTCTAGGAPFTIGGGRGRGLVTLETYPRRAEDAWRVYDTSERHLKECDKVDRVALDNRQR